MQRLVVAMLATVLVNSSACGGSSRSEQLSPPGMAGVGGKTAVAVGASGGAASIASAGLGAGGNVSGTAGASGTGEVSAGGTGNSAGDGQAGEAGCHETAGTCSCDWQTPACVEYGNAYSGQHCPPTLDETRLFANWPLGGAPILGKPVLNGEYTECGDGIREFSFGECDDVDRFSFDAQGHLLAWTQTGQSCAGWVCDANTIPSSTCMVCAMTSDPPAEGKSCFSREMNNGPTTPCVVDADGHWLMPPLCND